jgi:uncharacterized membrane protein YoaK (UPF0700 family)
MGVQNATLSHFGPLSVRTTHVTGTLAKFVDETVRWVCARSYLALLRFPLNTAAPGAAEREAPRGDPPCRPG